MKDDDNSKDGYNDNDFYDFDGGSLILLLMVIVMKTLWIQTAISFNLFLSGPYRITGSTMNYRRQRDLKWKKEHTFEWANTVIYPDTSTQTHLPYVYNAEPLILTLCCLSQFCKYESAGILLGSCDDKIWYWSYNLNFWSQYMFSVVYILHYYILPYRYINIYIIFLL